MFNFFLRKNFLDRWDHFFPTVILNFFVSVICAGLLFLAKGLGQNIILSLSLVLAVLLFCFYRQCLVCVASKWSRFETVDKRLFFKALKGRVGHCFFCFAIDMFIALSILFIIPYYLSTGAIWGRALAVCLGLLCVYLAISLQYFYCLPDKPVVNFNRCLAITLDNLGFSIAFGIKLLIDLIISILTFGLLPGLTGIAISQVDASRIILAHYNSSSDTLLEEEKEKIGERTIKNTFFPSWKK